MWLPRQCHLPIVTSQWVFTVTSLYHCHASHFMNGTVTSALGKPCNILTLTNSSNCIIVLIYNYFAKNILLCQTLIFQLKFTKFYLGGVVTTPPTFYVVQYNPPGLNMALVCICIMLRAEKNMNNVLH